MPLLKCEFCGIKGARHDGVYSCVHDLAGQLKKTKKRLLEAEDLLFYVVTGGMMNAFIDEYDLEDSDLEKVREIKEFTGFDD